MANTCGDDRFELIAMAREKLINGTNISDRPYEMDALDSILFRCWQMGWLDQLRDGAPMTDTEKEALERRIDELCAENEQLRQQNAKLDELLPENERWFSFDVVRSLNDERDQLADENAKLRELVHGFAIYRHFDCQHCGYREQCKAGQTNCYKAYVDLIKRARQMGIEVDA